MAKATVVESPLDRKVFGTSENKHGGTEQRNRCGKTGQRKPRKLTGHAGHNGKDGMSAHQRTRLSSHIKKNLLDSVSKNKAQINLDRSKKTVWRQ